MFYYQLFLLAFVPCFVVSSIFPYPIAVGKNGFGTDTTLTASCTQALNSTIDCDPSFQTLAISNAIVSPNSTTIASALCAPSCNSSLTAYQNNVLAQCGSTSVVNPPLPNNNMGQYLQDYYSLICTQESATGQYCADFLNAAWGALGNISDFSQVPKSILCSECSVSFFTTLQSSPFYGYNLEMAFEWYTAQQICDLDLPVDVNPASNLTVPAPVQAPSARTCASGNTTTVQPEDTCESIALANSVSQGTLWSINNLTPNCTLLEASQSLCLPKQCETYTVQPGDSCWSIATDNDLSFSQVLSYNPTINPSCSNLGPSGSQSVICISNPNGQYVPLPVGTPDIPGDKTQFANSSVPAPGDIPFGTTTNCGTWYQIQVADDCERISLSAAISLALFELINPSINTDCTNLIPGLWYCTQPVNRWNTTSSNTTSSSVTIAPPAPTEPGTTDTCTFWQVIQAGDSCALLEEVYGITMDQLTAWNPTINSTCGNLILGDAYCVQGPAISGSGTTSGVLSTTTTTSASSSGLTMTTIAPPGPTPSGTIGSCFKWHLVVSGDNCGLLETDFNISMDQLVLWNPSIDTNCDNLLLGEAYCVDGSSSTTSSSASGPTTVAPPGPTPPGTISTCFEWHLVVSGDFCALLEQDFNISMDQLVLWNPSIDANCNNLLLGEAYCVKGPSS